MRKNIIVFAAFCCVFFLLGCNQEDESINVALFKAPASNRLADLVNEFEKTENIKVNVEILSYADLKSKLEQKFYSKSTEYDVVMADCIWIPSFVERGYLGSWIPTKEQFKDYNMDDLIPELDDYLGHYPKGGKRYGVPFMSNTQMMAYNPKLIRKAVEELGLTLPGQESNSAWTWDEYKKVAEMVTKYGKESKPIFYGTALQARAGAWIIYEWYSILFGFVENNDARKMGLPNFNKYGAEPIKYYRDLYTCCAPKDSLTWGHEEETSAMCSGLTAMDATSNVELAANLIKGCEAKINFAFPPIGVTGKASPDMGGYGLMLSSYSNKRDFSIKFILWATSKLIHRQIVLGGGTPIRYSETKDKVILAKYPYLKFYDKLIASSVYRARIPLWPKLEDIMSREIVKAMKKEQTPNESAMNIDLWINRNIRE